MSSKWVRVWVREYGFPDRRIELRDDVAEGWEWMLFEGGMSRTYGLSRSLAAAKRTAAREAKRLGWSTAK